MDTGGKSRRDMVILNQSIMNNNELNLTGTLSNGYFTFGTHTSPQMFEGILHVTSKVPTRDWNGEHLKVIKIPIRALGKTAEWLWENTDRPVHVKGRLILHNPDDRFNYAVFADSGELASKLTLTS